MAKEELSQVRDAVLSETSTARGPTPPYNCATGWIKDFFNLARSMKITTIDNKFVSNFIIGSGNEGKVIRALKYLQVVDQNGQATEKVNLLKTEGDTFKLNLKRIVEEAYADLLTNIDIRLAKPDIVYGYFTDSARWNYTLDQAKDATKFFVWLAKESGMEISSELSRMRSEPRSKESREQRSKKEDILSGDNEQQEEAVKPKSPATKSLIMTPRTLTVGSNIQATITMSLDSNTPVEVWQMALKLLGLKDEEDSTNDLPN